MLQNFIFNSFELKVVCIFALTQQKTVQQNSIKGKIILDIYIVFNNFFLPF